MTVAHRTRSIVRPLPRLLVDGLAVVGLVAALRALEARGVIPPPVTFTRAR